ncbi:L-ornithine N5-oxygenase [Rhodotorula toruloides]|uniref:L-ornithine N(5)-monooxygenase [NAD(P)H] n=1 Tax=Rhodotorula toruloides TaxID=5286 RepID=A0A511KLJ8_RHOTO|nr:L-ornithine N5-oxygenase [Rhodotorula toruloides]
MERPTPDSIFDTLSIGFGPASVALAIALAELNSHPPRPSAQPLYSSLGGLQHALGFDAEEVAREQRKRRGEDKTNVKAAFVERHNGFRWHPGMMLEGSKMQISFLKDLATLRNPQSPYTFLSYLASFQPSRLVSFISLSTFTPSRREFADYLQWCAEKVTAELRAQGGEVSFGEEVVGVDALRPDEHDQGADVRVLRVTSRVLETGELVHRYTRNLVVSAGGSPKVPSQLAAPELVQTGRVLHTASFLEHIHRVLPEVVERANEERPIRLAVVGAGQSAAECFLHLRTKLAPLLPRSSTSSLSHRPQIDMLIRSSALRPTDEGQFSNEVFDPSMSQAVYRLGQAERERVLGEAKSTNYSIVNPKTLDVVYETMYDQKVEEDIAERTCAPAKDLLHDPRLNIRPYTEIREASPTSSGAIELVLFNPITREERTETYDAVVCGTGYDRQAWRNILFRPTHESVLAEGEAETIPLAALFDTTSVDEEEDSSSAASPAPASSPSVTAPPALSLPDSAFADLSRPTSSSSASTSLHRADLPSLPFLPAHTLQILHQSRARL